MPNETITQSAQADQRDSKSVSGNIIKGIQDKANGTNVSQEKSSDTNEAKSTLTPDPNAGKEKYTVDGREIWLSPEQAKAYTQKGISFEPKIDQLNRLQKETTQFYYALLNDPGTVLTNLSKQAGVPMKDIVKKILKGNASDEVKEIVGGWYYEEAVEPLRLTPEQLKAREDAKYRQERERSDSEAKDMAIKQENLRRVEVAMDQIKSNISEAMKESGLPSNDSALGVFMARRAADVMRLGYFQKKIVTPKEAIDKVKSEMKMVQTAWYDHLDDDAFAEELGETNMEKAKKYLLKLVKQADKKIPELKSSGNTRAGERKTKNMDDFHAYIEERKRNG